jgi:hypothetical protein
MSAKVGIFFEFEVPLKKYIFTKNRKNVFFFKNMI